MTDLSSELSDMFIIVNSVGRFSAQGKIAITKTEAKALLAWRDKACNEAYWNGRMSENVIGRSYISRTTEENRPKHINIMERRYKEFKEKG